MQTLNQKKAILRTDHMTRSDGIQLPVAILPDEGSPSHELEITGSSGDHYLVRDHDGRIFPFPATEQTRIARLGLSDGQGDRLMAGDHEYRRYRHYAPGETDRDFFNQNPDLIWRNRSLVLNDARYFLIQAPQVLQSSGTWRGTDTYCLGGLLESWMTRNVLKAEDPQDGSTICIFHAGGWSLPGNHQWNGWNPSRNEWVSGWSFPHDPPADRRYIPSDKKLGNLLQEFRRIGDRYPDYCNVTTASLKELIQNLKSAVRSGPDRTS